MSRILFAWEMGSNLGHLSRLLPIGRRLRDQGHEVIVMTQDLATAAEYLVPAGISFMQAPRASRTPGVANQPAGYAEILWRQGWGQVSHLRGIIEGWLTAFRLWKPDVIVIDHGPSARLAAHIADIPCALIGTGFELPPATDPLPSFPGLEAANARLLQVEKATLACADEVLREYGRSGLSSLREVVSGERKFFATFAELDHYTARPTERYIGPIGAWEGKTQPPDFPGGRPRIFLYIRPDTALLTQILAATAMLDASVVCYAPSVDPRLVATHQSRRFIASTTPFALAKLLPTIDLCVSYASAAVTAATLLNGIPQVLFPTHVEAQLTAHRVSSLGAGITLRNIQDAESIAAAFQGVLSTPGLKRGAAAFARRYADYSSDKVVDWVTAEIVGLRA